MQLGLTEEELAERRKGIGGSDATKIMKGEWLELWQEKTHLKQGEDLSNVFRVQLGHVTEDFNLHWMARNNTDECFDIEYKPGVHIHQKHKFMRCTPDALCFWNGQVGVIDAKHMNQYVDEDYVIRTYYWQMVHNAIVTGATTCIISAILGNDIIDPIVWELDPEDAALLIDREADFWWCVLNNQAPTTDFEVEAKAMPKYDEMRIVSMEGNNEWATNAVTFLENKEAAAKFEKAKKAFKPLMEDDVKEATGYGVQAKRSKSNAVRITEDKNYMQQPTEGENLDS